MNTKYEYPFVECPDHPGPQLGVIVCEHVLSGQARIDGYEPPTNKELGWALCKRCNNSTELEIINAAKLKCVCLKHLEKDFRIS